MKNQYDPWDDFADVEEMLREILRNQCVIMHALGFSQDVPNRTKDHLEEREESTRKLLEE